MSKRTQLKKLINSKELFRLASLVGTDAKKPERKLEQHVLNMLERAYLDGVSEAYKQQSEISREIDTIKDRMIGALLSGKEIEIKPTTKQSLDKGDTDENR